MFGLKFLSNEKKRLLQKLEDRLAKASTPQLRNETQLAIQEIMAQAKPYTECDLFEAEELKSQLLQRINTLSGLGKIASVQVFQMHLKDVDFHLQSLLMAESLKEQEKYKNEEPANLADKAPTLNAVKKQKQRKEAFAQHRWVIGFEDEPDDENK